jgi:peroxidase
MYNDAHIVPDSTLFAAGDVRANQSVELMALHTLFVREHNRIANAIQADNPGFSDERLYQLARRLVGAEIQAITYNEWIPALLGPNALPAYTGYKPSVNPGIANEFSTAGFRFLPSLSGEFVRFIDNTGMRVRSDVNQAETFFNPAMLDQGISPILKFLASDPAEELDTHVVGSFRNFLYGPPPFGFDGVALDIQRGRDHGLANYNRVRVAYGLPALTSISQITSNPDLQLKLEQLYGGINRLDLWAGAMAEDHVPGTSTGPLVRAMLIDQFTRLRDGDSFFYKNPNVTLPFSHAEQSFLENNRSLADVIRRNSSADVIQDNIFFFRVSISGEVFNDQDLDGRHDAGEPGLAGLTVTLIALDENQQPTVVATDLTDANGRYSFIVFDGLSVGNYQVVESLPAGWSATSPLIRPVNIPRGETFLDVDFGNVRTPLASAQ